MPDPLTDNQTRGEGQGESSVEPRAGGAIPLGYFGAPDPTPAERRGRRHWRVTLLILLAASAVGCAAMFAEGLRAGADGFDRFLVVAAPAVMLLCVGAFALFWFFGLHLLAAVAFVPWFLGDLQRRRDISWGEWRGATLGALWPMPFAAAAGVALIFWYSIRPPGLTPNDVVFGTLGNLLGAWCYGTIIWNWGRMVWGKPRSRS